MGVGGGIARTGAAEAAPRRAFPAPYPMEGARRRPPAGRVGGAKRMRRAKPLGVRPTNAGRIRPADACERAPHEHGQDDCVACAKEAGVAEAIPVLMENREL